MNARDLGALGWGFYVRWTKSMTHLVRMSGRWDVTRCGRKPGLLMSMSNAPTSAVCRVCLPGTSPTSPGTEGS